MINKYDQGELLVLVSKGDKEAFGIIYHEYFDMVYSVAFAFTKSKELAKDVSQEIFIRIWHYRGKLAEVNNFEHWLVRVARNHIRNTLKKKVLLVQNETWLLTYLKDNAPTGQEKMEWKEDESKILSVIAKLPPQLHQVFCLSRFEGLSHEQIATKMNISKVVSRNRVARALLFLRKYLYDYKGRCIVLAGSICFFF